MDIITTMLVGKLADRPDPSRQLMLYLDEDTKIPYVCDGEAWHTIGGGGGGIVGLVSDGQNGATLLGFLAVGGGSTDPNTPLRIDDGAGNEIGAVDKYGVLLLSHRGTSTDVALNVHNNTTHSDFSFYGDGSLGISGGVFAGGAGIGGTLLFAAGDNGMGGYLVSINAQGFLGVGGKNPPTAPRTLAQATIDAITDASTKTAMQACADALADMGALTLT